MGLSRPLIGGVSTPVVIDCTGGCGEKVIVPVGTVVRIPVKPSGDFCHEIVDPRTGTVYTRGGHR